MINFISRRNHLLSLALRIVDVCQDTERAAPPCYLPGGAFEMLSQDNVLRIIAKLTSKQIESANIRGVFLDADPHGDPSFSNRLSIPSPVPGHGHGAGDAATQEEPA